MDEALAHAEEALIDLLTMLEEDGEDLPQPSAPEDLELETGEMVAYVKVVRKPLVSVKTAAAELGVSVGRVRQLWLSGLIVGAERMGRDWMIPSPVVRKVLARGRRPSAGSEKGSPGLLDATSVPEPRSRVLSMDFWVGPLQLVMPKPPLPSWPSAKSEQWCLEQNLFDDAP